MRGRKLVWLLLLLSCLAIVAYGLARGRATPAQALSAQIVAVEQAFAASMAERDIERFTGFLSPEAVFMQAGTAQHGRAAVVAAWRGYFDGAQAPFSWVPDQVEVLASGTLAFSSGPVRDPQGKQIGRFNSVWRLEGPGTWRVVFDHGCDCRP